jgi:hypothetical protein
MMAVQTRRRRAVQKLAHVALVAASIVVEASARCRPPLPTSSISRFRAHKSVTSDMISNIRGGAIDDGRKPPPPSRYSSNYDDVGRYDRQGRDNSSRRFDEYDDRPSRNGRRYPNYDDRNLDDRNNQSQYDGKKSKGWFGRSKEEGSPSYENEQSDQGDSWNNNNGAAGLPPPPPPPPPPPQSVTTDASLNININPAETERTPIHYKFPTAEVAADERRAKDTAMEDTTMDKSDDLRDAPDIPFIEEDELSDDRDRSTRRRRRRSDDEDDAYSSPRRDAVTTYMSTKKGAFKVRLGSVIVGAALGGFVGKVSLFTLCLVLSLLYMTISKLASQ